MKRKLVLFFLMLAASMHAFATSPTQALARAIAKAEGYYTRGTLPTGRFLKGKGHARSVIISGDGGATIRAAVGA